MLINSIKTHKVTKEDNDILKILDRYISTLEEGSIVAVASKIVAICEGRTVPSDVASKDDLIKQEADYYLPKEESRYSLYLTIKNNILAVSAGIDESNVKSGYLLWPEDPQKSANRIREHLAAKYNLKKIGVIVTDSKSTPLRWGVMGISLAHSGFLGLNDKIGIEDIFGRKLKMTKEAIADGLAASSTLVMGESNEQTPIAIITDVQNVEFQDRNPNEKELTDLKIEIDDDAYAPLLRAAKWRKGGIK